MQATSYYCPFSSLLAMAMMVAHHLGGPVQSNDKTTKFMHTLGSLGFNLNPVDLCNFNATLENRKLDTYLTGMPDSTFPHKDGWLESSVQIRLPLDKEKMLETDAAEFEVGGILHPNIINIISLVYQSNAVESFNHIPFKEFWKPSEDAPPNHLYGEIFSSEEMLNADDKICKCCLVNDLDSEDIEVACVPLLLYSDLTHLTNFGTAS